MPVTSEAAYERFGKWVRNALLDARGRGMTDEDIAAATGVKARTFHRWQSGKFGPRGPQADTVYKFCDGLGLPRATASSLLGWSDEPTRAIITQAEAEPELTPEVRELLRRLRDPGILETEKFHIIATLKALVNRRPARKS